jgi:hypothetical protein
MDNDTGVLDERRVGVPDWRLLDTVRWCSSRGYDNILLSRDDETVTFGRSPVEGVTHHGGAD